MKLPWFCPRQRASPGTAPKKSRRQLPEAWGRQHGDRQARCSAGLGDGRISGRSCVPRAHGAAAAARGIRAMGETLGLQSFAPEEACRSLAGAEGSKHGTWRGTDLKPAQGEGSLERALSTPKRAQMAREPQPQDGPAQLTRPLAAEPVLDVVSLVGQELDQLVLVLLGNALTLQW